MKNVTVAIACVLLLLTAEVSLGAQQTILGGPGILWGDEKVKLNANFAEVTNLQTLSGVPAASTSLGVFTGVTIADNATIKAAFQSLETALEAGGGGTMIYPGAGIPASTGSAWGTSYTLDTDLSSVSASDDTIPSAKATKAAIDAVSAGLTSLPTADNQIIQATGAGTYAWTDTLEGLGDITGAGKYNNITVTQPATGATLTLVEGSTLATAGANSLTLTTTGDSSPTFPAGTYSLGISGKNEAATASKATTYTIGTDSANELFGGTIYVTSAATITAPAIAVGHNYCVTTIGDIAVSLDVNGSDKMILDGVTLADGDKATNTSKSGDTICCQYYSADGQYCWSGTVLGGHWTDGN